MDSLRPDSMTDGNDLPDLSRRFLRGAPESDDVAQEVWLLLRRQEKLENRVPWLRTTMLRLSSRWRRQESGRRFRERSVARADGTPSVADELERKARREAAHRLVDSLADPYREVLRLRYLEDLEIEEVAARLGRPAATVRSQIKRGLDRLREQTPERDRRWTWNLLALLRRPRASRATPWVVGTGLCTGIFALLMWQQAPDDARAGEIRGTAWTAEGDSPVHDVSYEPAAESERMAVLLGLAPLPEPGDWDIDAAGTVRDPAGNPVPDAAILWQRDEKSASFEVTRTDAAGRYVLQEDRRGLVWAESPGYGPSWRCLLASRRPDQDLDLTLGHPIGSLVGFVRTLDNGPLENGWIEIIGTEFEPYPLEASDRGVLERAPPPVHVPIELDGSFRTALPLVQPFRILVTAEGRSPLVTTVDRESAFPVELDLALPEHRRVSGHLLRADGSPVVDAALELDLPEPFEPVRDRTDRSGHFTFEALPHAGYQVRLVEDPGHPESSCFHTGSLAEGPDASLELRLDDSSCLHGVAHREDGSPLAGWSVRLLHMPHGFPKRIQAAQTDREGRFHLPSCDPSPEKVLYLFDPESPGGPPVAVQVEVRPGGEPLELIVPVQPPRRARARFRLACEAPGSLPTLVAFHSNAEGGMRWVTPVDEVFEVDLKPSKYQVMVLFPDIGSYLLRRILVAPDLTRITTLDIPRPGWLEIRPEFDGDLGWDDLSLKLKTTPFGSFDARSANPRIDRRREGDRVRLPLFPGTYEVNVKIGEARYRSCEYAVRPGQTTLETLRVPDVVPVILQVDLQERLAKGEGLTLRVVGSGEPHELGLGRVEALTTSPRYPVALEKDTRRLELSSRKGREGTIDIPLGSLVPGAVLTMPLVWPDGRPPSDDHTHELSR